MVLIFLKFKTASLLCQRLPALQQAIPLHADVFLFKSCFSSKKLCCFQNILLFLFNYLFQKIFFKNICILYLTFFFLSDILNSTKQKKHILKERKVQSTRNDNLTSKNDTTEREVQSTENVSAFVFSFK